MQKSPQVVKHVVKCEKWACSTPKAGKNKPILYIAKTRDFKRFCEINKEKCARDGFVFAAQGCDDDYMYLDADEYSEYDSIDDVPSEKVDFTFVIGCYEIISGKPHQKWCGF